MPAPLPGIPDVPALNHMTVQQMIEATPLGPILDRTVADVLGGMGLPPLPVLPPLPPMPGLPPLQPPNLDMFIKPMTDLLGGFGTGDLSGGGFDPTIIFESLTKVLETSMTMGQSALKLADQLWTGQGAVSAGAKTAEAGANSSALATQGSGISLDTKTAAAIVAKGLAVVQGIIAATIAKITSMAVPMMMTPAVGAGFAAAAGFASIGLSQATAAVAVTRAELLGPTTAMAVNGAPVAVTGAPTAGAGQSPFTLASSILDVVSPAMSTATELPTSLMQPISKMLNVDHESPAVVPAALTPKAKGGGGGGGGGIGGVGGVMTPLSASRPTVPTNFSLSEPALGGASSARPMTATPAAMPMGGAPMGAAGARGAGASDDQHAVPDYLVTEDNGRRVVGDSPEVAPAVIGYEEAAESDPSPDIELRLGVPGPKRNEEV
ncbi:hypothetical protein [Gordonia terrae]|nr:hypothetical protein [Gordonia terrae]